MNINKKAPKSMIMGMCVLLMILAIIAGIQIYKIHPDIALKIKDTITKDTEVPNDDKEYTEIQDKMVDMYSFYTTVHQMANTQIIAEDDLVWGRIDITPTKCKAVLKFMTNNEALIKKYIGTSKYDSLVDGITKWENGDYSKSTEIHNIVWEKLGGVYGKAKQNHIVR